MNKFIQWILRHLRIIHRPRILEPLVVDRDSSITSNDIRLASWDIVCWQNESSIATVLLSLWTLPKAVPDWGVGKAIFVPIDNDRIRDNSSSYHPPRSFDAPDAPDPSDAGGSVYIPDHFEFNDPSDSDPPDPLYEYPPNFIQGSSNTRNNDEEAVHEPIAPLRLFDCENRCLKDREAYIRETNGLTPEYHISVSNSYWTPGRSGMLVPTIPWPIPVESEVKWYAILDYWREKIVKWMWMDILCINQAKTDEARKEQFAEELNSDQYYRQAVAGVLLPDALLEYTAPLPSSLSPELVPFDTAHSSQSDEYNHGDDRDSMGASRSEFVGAFPPESMNPLQLTEFKDTQVKNVPVFPLRLFDCQDGSLKTRESYLRETNGVAPEYLIVSQVWGDAKPLFWLPTVAWPILIASMAKWEAILDYCKRTNVKWLWMDILCVKQDDSDEASREKATEIPMMRHYYKGATACLVVPDGYLKFGETYRKLMAHFKTTIDSSRSSRINNEKQKKQDYIIWENIALLDAIMSDKWFGRIWTYQELLLSKRPVLLDGRDFDFHGLTRLIIWYHNRLQSGSLTKPAGGRAYDFIYAGADNVLSTNWIPEWRTAWDEVSDRHWGRWSVEIDVQYKGSVDLITLVILTRYRDCKVQVDRLLGLYGLLNDTEMVPIQTTSGNSDNPTRSLEEMWKATLRKVISSGKVWPLLHDMMNLDPDEVEQGERWMPEITALRRRPDPVEIHPETLESRNNGKIMVTKAGLEIPVRVVGQVIGTSISFGEGEGEIDKLLACIWVLRAKGFDTDLVVRQLKDGYRASNGVQFGEDPESDMRLDFAFEVNGQQSMGNFFDFFKDEDIRNKLATAPGVGGGDRTVLIMRIEGQNKPMVCLAWTHRSLLPTPKNCWVLDVTSDPAAHVFRWAVANRIKKNIFRKIGTVRSYPELIFKGGSVRPADIIFV